MTTTTDPIRTRCMSSETDWWRARDLLIHTFPITGPGFNWEIRHWEGNRFHRPGASWQPENYQNVCLWEAFDGQLLGFAFVDDDELCLNLHPASRAQIEPEMLAWGEENTPKVLEDGRRQVHVLAYEYDAPRIRLLQQRGYEKMTYGWINRRMKLVSQPLREPVVAEGYTLRSTRHGDLDDCQRMADLLNAAFNRPGFHTAEEYLSFSTRTLCYRNELNLVMEAPDGSFAAHAALNYDEANRYAIFEPVCTHPDHRKKGLAQALMFEGLHRVQLLGAREIEVCTGITMAANGLYDTIGFTEHYPAYYWRKIFE